MRVLLIFFFTLAGYLFSNAQGIGTGMWRLHLPFKTLIGLESNSTHIYAWANSGFYRVDRSSGEIEILSKTQGFHGTNVANIRHHEDLNLTFIAYSDGFIDLIRNNSILGISDIERANIQGEKKIYDFHFENNLIYISCSFGIVVFDVNRMETRASFLNLGFGEILDVAVSNNQLFLISEQGLFSGSLNQNLNDPSNWQLRQSGDFKGIESSQNQVYVNDSATLFLWNNSTLQSFSSFKPIKWLRNKQIGLTVVNSDGAGQISGTQVNILNPDQSINAAVFININESWLATQSIGLYKNINGNLDFYTPQGPYSNTAGKIVDRNGEIWIGGGSITSTGGATFSLKGYYIFKDNQWINSLDQNYPYNPLYRDFYYLTHDKKSNDMWLSAYYQGILWLRQNGTYEFFDEQNSSLTLSTGMYVSGLVTDDKANLWVANYSSNTPISVRTSAGVWKSFFAGNNNFLTDPFIDNSGNKWFIVRRNSSGGLLVYNDNKTPLDENDDQFRLLNTNQGTGNLLSNNVLAAAIDLEGKIWVGTDKGLTIINSPNNVFAGRPYDAAQIIIGTGDNAGYLLGAEVITSIVIDGGNRKWIGTRNGLWLVSADGSKILQYFNTENSPLISNNILELGINGISGELFIYTDRGLISYRTDGTDGADVHTNVKVFPNPVKNNYSGLITISGLVTDANIKITDISGNLVYETVANGGTATWDGNNFSGRKASSGVYLIFSSNNDGTETFITKLLIIRGN